jgi:hypothetical protein
LRWGPRTPSETCVIFRRTRSHFFISVPSQQLFSSQFWRLHDIITFALRLSFRHLSYCFYLLPSAFFLCRLQCLDTPFLHIFARLVRPIDTTTAWIASEHGWAHLRIWVLGLG